MKLATSRLIDGSPCDEIDMVIKDLDLEPKINAIMRDVLEYHIVPFGELNGVPIAFVDRFEVISKSIDRIFVSHGGQRKWVTNSGYEEKIDNEKANRLELKVSLDRNQASRTKLNYDRNLTIPHAAALKT
ncbi:hypothetical protein Tco_0648745 [Tanacetum coccineum]